MKLLPLSLSALILFRLGLSFADAEALYSVKPEDWVNYSQVTELNKTDEEISGNVIGPQPRLETGVVAHVAADQVSTIVIRMSSTHGGRIHFYWATAAEPGFSDERFHRWAPIHSDGEVHEYIVHTSELENWSGELTRFRIDPGAWSEKFGEFRLISCELLTELVEQPKATTSTPTSNKTTEAHIPKTVSISSDLKLAKATISTPASDPSLFSPNGMILWKDKPSFVIGLGELPIVKSPFKAVAEAGFDFVVFGGVNKPLLESLRQENLGVLYAPHTAFDSNLSMEERAKRIRTAASNMEAHKDEILGYLSYDEPAWLNVPAEVIKEGYDLIKANLPRRPVFLNHAPRNTVAELKLYNSAADIIGCDIYPFPEGNNHSDLPNTTISVVGDYVDKMVEIAEPGQPVWMYLQAYAAGNPKVIPRILETRFMAYNAIMHGANGILYYGLRHLEWPNDMWPQLETLGKELHSIKSVLSAPWLSTFDPEAKKLGLEVRHKFVDGHLYLFVANTGKNTIQWDWKTDLPDQELHVLFEDRKVDLQNGSFNETLPPYEVRVYSTSELKKETRPSLASSEVLAPIEKTSAQWIWSKEHQQVDNITLYFRYLMQVPRVVPSASILITADDEFRLYCNGKLVGEDINGSQGGWQVAKSYNLLPFLRLGGRNVLAVEVKNNFSWGGLFAEVKIGDKATASTSGAWRVFPSASEGWTSVSFEDSDWRLADLFGTPPSKPWGAFLIPAAPLNASSSH